MGYLTPDDVPESLHCRLFHIPDSTEWLGTIMGALMPLLEPENWTQYGTLTPEEAAEAAFQIWLDAYADENQICSNVPTPFWDEAQDLDDEEPPDEQTWYGEVTDPEAPADELDFVENAAIWAFTGFIAYAGQIGGAIFFHTIAPRFVLAWKRGDLGEVIRVVIDAAEYGTVDTGAVGVGEIIELPVLAEESEDGHDILLVKVA